MVVLALKWMTIALVILTGFSALTAVYGYYQLNMGACSGGCDAINTYTAYMYVGLTGLFGFGMSALAAHMIGRWFKSMD